MNELYEKTIEVDGKIYWYDPDRDIYYRRDELMSPFDKYGWLVLIVILIGIITYMNWWN